MPHTRRSNTVVVFMTRDQRDTKEGFEALAQAAQRGEIVGAGYTVVDRLGRTYEGVLGVARHKPQLAHYGAERLAKLLLWPAETDFST